MRQSVTLKSVVASVALSCTCAPVVAQPFAQLAGSDSPSRHQQLMEGAKKEGGVIFYTSIPQKDMAVLSADFEKRYGVHVTVWRASTVKVLQRVLAEKSANRWDFDAVDISSPELESMYQEDALQEVSSVLHKELMEETMPRHRGWAPQFITVFVQAYNTRAIKKTDLPKTYTELSDPKWKGLLGVEVSDSDWYCAQVSNLGQDKGRRLFNEVALRNRWSVRSGHSLLANLVASGEVPVALTTYSYMIDQAKQTGAPVDWFAIDPVIARSNGIGVSRKPPHPYAALLFYEYMISEAQPLILKMNYLSPVKKLATPMRGAKLKFVDPMRARAEVERCDQEFATLNKLIK